LPLYEYECEGCGHRFEALQKFSDAPLEKCPKCGGALRKLQAAPAIQFKGSGWYVTDYAKKDAGGEKSDGAKDSKPAASDNTKGDTSKPATDGSSSTTSSSSGSATTPSPSKD
jgi:putative FmdB family regulatory protein